jgi:formiminotetrahydrofolate cyclodeaminase
LAAVAFTPSVQEQALRQTLLTNINSILAIKVDDLVQTERLGRDLSFEELRPVFQKTIMLFQALSTANLDFAGEKKLQGLANLAVQVTNEFNMIRSLQPSQYQNRPSRAEGMRERYEQAYEQIAPILGASQYATADAAALKKQQDAWNTHKAEMEKDMADTLTKAKDVAAKAGVSKHEEYFQSESNEHKRAAGAWLVATVVLAAITAVLAWFNYGKTLALLEPMIAKGNPNSVTDAGVGVLCIRSAVHGAYLNVLVNAKGLKDKSFAEGVIEKAKQVKQENEAKCDVLIHLVESAIA